MIRFRCGQCGHRIAIHKRRMAGLVLCPDCGGATQPLAEPLVQRRAAASRPSARPLPAQVCANCSQPIGRLQKLYLWDNHIVCGECRRKLAHDLPAGQPSATSGTTAVSVARRTCARPEPEAAGDAPLLDQYARPFRGGMFGALIGLCVAGAALYGALNLLKDVAGLVTGLAFGGLALLAIYLILRATVISRKSATTRPPARIGLRRDP